MGKPGRIVIVTSVFPAIFGGRTKSLLQRGRIFEKNGLNVLLYSTNHNDDYQDIFDTYRNKAYVLGRMSIDNMFEELGGFDNQLSGNVTRFIEMSGAALSVGSLREAFDGDAEALRLRVIARVARDSGGDVRHIDYVDPSNGVTTARAFVNRRQNVKRVRYLDPASGRPIHEDYLDSRLAPYARFQRRLGKKVFSRIDSDGRAGAYRSHKRFIADFLNDVVRDDDVIINDARGLDYSVRLVNKPVRKIYVMHNPHLVDPLDLRSGIKPSFRSILRDEGLSANETIVSLTQDQKDSVVAALPVLNDRVVVIGHTNHRVRLTWRWRRSTNRVGIIGRLDPQKNLGDAILAFKMFHKIFSRYSLDIYGRGQEEDSLKALVSSLGLEQVVNFRGFTHDVDAAFQSVDFTLNTSFFEGFPLAIIESISNGVPVASYPVNFGPRAILGDIAGRISEERTPQSLALEMVALATSRFSRKRIQRWSAQFSEEDFFRKWSSLIMDN